MAIINIENVSKQVSIKGKKKNLVSKLTFQLQEGEIVGYIGPNGAGKSTTIKMLCGILEPSEGVVEVCSLVPYKNRMKNGSNIGVVFGQRTQLWWDLPLIDSFRVLRQIYKVEKKVFEERLEYLSETFDIKKLFDSTVRTLSLGERMKADIVAALLHNPKVLFLDEPTIGLDFASKRKMREAILNINKKYKTTIILTTHDFTDIEELCHRIIVLNQGQIIYDGSMEEVNEKYRFERILEFSANEKLKAELAMFYKITDAENDKFLVNLGENSKNVNEVIRQVIDQYPSTGFLVKEPPLEDTIERILAL